MVNEMDMEPHLIFSSRCLFDVDQLWPPRRLSDQMHSHEIAKTEEVTCLIGSVSIPAVKP